MKKTNKSIAYILLAACTISNVKAQLPNSNFEDWTVANNVTDSLVGWSSTNTVVTPPTISLYNESANPYQGKNAAHIATRPFGFLNISTVAILVNGQAEFSYAGNITNYVSGGGTPISYKPIELKGYYKTPTQDQNNLPLVKVLLSKYNTTTNKRDTVSYIEYSFASSLKYSPFSIQLVDLMPSVIPDTITTIFYSSGPTTGNSSGLVADFYLDSLTVPMPITTNVTNELDTKLEFNVFPNPSSGSFTIQSLNEFSETIVIYNMLGKIVKTVQMEESQYSSQVDMSSFPSGTYFLKSNNQSGKVQKLILSN